MLVGSVGYIGCRYLINGSNIVHCQHKELEGTSDNHFDWNKLLSYLSPDIFNLIAAIAVSILISNYFEYSMKETNANFFYHIIYFFFYSCRIRSTTLNYTPYVFIFN